MFGALSLFKGGRNMIRSFLHPERGYEKAQEQLGQYYNQGQNYLAPYHQQGQEAYGKLNGAMDQLLNPEQLYGRFAQSYETSPATMAAQERGRNSSLEAASSMGLMGSSAALNALNAQNQDIENNALQDYIKMLTGQYLEGAHLAQGVYGQGANAAGALSNNANMQGQNMGNLAYGKQNAPGQLFNDLLKTGAYAYAGSGNPSQAGGTEYGGPQPRFNPYGSR
jgi:hypothetical protein